MLTEHQAQQEPMVKVVLQQQAQMLLLQDQELVLIHICTSSRTYNTSLWPELVAMYLGFADGKHVHGNTRYSKFYTLV
jgi:hypothetical protein